MDYSNTTFLEYQKKKKEILDDLGRTSGICDGVSCRCCPFSDIGKHHDMNCRTVELLYPEEALNAVMSYEPKVDWTKVPVDTKILVKDYRDGNWVRRHFANYSNGKVYAYSDGKTSFSTDITTPWEHAKLYKEDEK